MTAERGRWPHTLGRVASLMNLNLSLNLWLHSVTWFSRSFWDSQTQDAPSLFFPGLLCLLATPAIRGDPIGRMASNSLVGILILWCSYTGCSNCDTKNWCIFLRSTDLRIKYHCKSWFQTVHRLKPNHETWTWTNLQSATSVKPFLTWIHFI